MQRQKVVLVIHSEAQLVVLDAIVADLALTHHRQSEVAEVFHALADQEGAVGSATE